MATLATLSIPTTLRSWEQNTNGFQLFRVGLGYLHIKYVARDQQWALTLRPSLNDYSVGQHEDIAAASTAAELAQVAHAKFHGAYRATLEELQALGYASHLQAIQCERKRQQAIQEAAATIAANPHLFQSAGGR